MIKILKNEKIIKYKEDYKEFISLCKKLKKLNYEKPHIKNIRQTHIPDNL